MYFYRGINIDSNEMFEKTFDDESKAIDFARDNTYKYQKYTIKDDEEEIIESDEIAEDEEDAIMDDMFPEEDSMEGFDMDDFYDNE